jgi:hypothetical protein
MSSLRRIIRNSLYVFSCICFSVSLLMAQNQRIYCDPNDLLNPPICFSVKPSIVYKYKLIDVKKLPPDAFTNLTGVEFRTTGDYGLFTDPTGNIGKGIVYNSNNVADSLFNINMFANTKCQI